MSARTAPPPSRRRRPRCCATGSGRASPARPSASRYPRGTAPARRTRAGSCAYASIGTSWTRSSAVTASVVLLQALQQRQCARQDLLLVVAELRHPLRQERVAACTAPREQGPALVGDGYARDAPVGRVDRALDEVPLLEPRHDARHVGRLHVLDGGKLSERDRARLFDRGQRTETRRGEVVACGD